MKDKGVKGDVNNKSVKKKSAGTETRFPASGSWDGTKVPGSSIVSRGR